MGRPPERRRTHLAYLNHANKMGSCNPDSGRLWINLDLVKKPLVCLDYVILHEMAHFVSRRHDDVFVVLSQILLEFECGHRPDIIMLRAQQTAEMR